MILDRTTPPAFQPINHIDIPEVYQDILSNETEVHHAVYGTQGVFKLELFFDAGHIYSEHRENSVVFPKMLLAGTTTKNAQEVHEAFDQFGGFVEPSQGPTTFRFTLYGLKKHFEKFLPLINDVFENATFPADELETHKSIALQSLLVNQQKPSYIAGNKFKEELFGLEHPLGWHPQAADIENIDRNGLVHFYNNVFKKAKMSVFVSGEVSNNFLSSLEQAFGFRVFQEASKKEIEVKPSSPSQVIIEQSDAMQSTIRLGKVLFPRNHPDFFPLLVANTAFGGYFGSRLMRNIREKKGFTYGISSSIVPASNTTYFAIGTDVVKENTQETLIEIKKELSFLHENLISSLELETIKNYINGNFASSLSSSFDVMDKKRNRLIQNLPEDFHSSFVEKILAVTAEDCRAVLQKHIQFEDLVEVIVGEKL